GPKNGGKDWRLKKVDATFEMLPVTRVKRSATVSAAMAARTLPLFAVNALTCKATVWPGTMTDASVLFVKGVATTGKPLLSTRNGFTLLRVTCIGSPRLRLAPMRLLDEAREMSFVTIWNCVEDDGTEVTMPSIQSELVGAIGSYSSAVKVPSELRTVSTLANCPTAGVQAAPVVTQFGIKTVEEFSAAVIEPQVEVWTVTEDAEAAVTVPVTSSIKSN